MIKLLSQIKTLVTNSKKNLNQFSQKISEKIGEVKTHLVQKTINNNNYKNIAAGLHAVDKAISRVTILICSILFLSAISAMTSISIPAISITVITALSITIAAFAIGTIITDFFHFKSKISKIKKLEHDKSDLEAKLDRVTKIKLSITQEIEEVTGVPHFQFLAEDTTPADDSETSLEKTDKIEPSKLEKIGHKLKYLLLKITMIDMLTKTIQSHAKQLVQLFSILYAIERFTRNQIKLILTVPTVSNLAIKVAKLAPVTKIFTLQLTSNILAIGSLTSCALLAAPFVIPYLLFPTFVKTPLKNYKKSLEKDIQDTKESIQKINKEISILNNALVKERELKTLKQELQQYKQSHHSVQAVKSTCGFIRKPSAKSETPITNAEEITVDISLQANHSKSKKTHRNAGISRHRRS